ncbi:MAG: type II secretion system minor pseudopilin GspI [Gammaproteobacteria bacterium]
MRRTRTIAGFTLLEVLVALALVATALGGTLALVRGAIANQDYLERRLYADWVADNTLNALRLEPARFDEAEQEGSETVLGRRFDWRVTITPIEPDGTIDGAPPRERVSVHVTDEASRGDALAERETVRFAGSSRG